MKGTTSKRDLASILCGTGAVPVDGLAGPQFFHVFTGKVGRKGTVADAGRDLPQAGVPAVTGGKYPLHR